MKTITLRKEKGDCPDCNEGVTYHGEGYDQYTEDSESCKGTGKKE